MLDGLLGRGFASKCKSLLKLIKSRIDVIRRKKNATLKFLKKDMADLLANGLDINAYGRADGLLAELNISYCYDFVEQCCDFVLRHLSVMQKVSGCPEDCREAVSSLMFAAARFSDLPELRDLRQLFQERYDNSLEYFVNQEFVEKLASKPATMDKKVQLMQHIASEFSIKWDSKAFQRRMSKSPASPQDQPKNCGSFNVPKDKYLSINGNGSIPREGKHDFSYNDRLERASDGHGLRNGKESDMLKRNELVLQSRQALASDGCKQVGGGEESTYKMGNHSVSPRGQEVIGDKHGTRDRKEVTALKTVRGGSSSHGRRMEYIDDGTFKPHGGRENAVPKRENKETLPKGKAYVTPTYAEQHLKSDGKDLLDSGNCSGQLNNGYSSGKVQEEEIAKLKPHYNIGLPPPYVKRNAKPKDGKYEASLGFSPLGFEGNVVPKDPQGHIRANGSDISERIQVGSDRNEHERHFFGSTRVSSLDDGKDHYHEDDGTATPLRKARSARRRHLKSPSGHDDVDNAGDAGGVRRKSRSRRRDDSRRGLQILFDDEHYQNNEEERIIDKLLMHYSKKPTTYEQGYVKRKSKSRQAQHQGSDIGESPQTLRRNVSDDMSEVFFPVRSISLPRDQPASSEAKRELSRTVSDQPARSNVARHVHPKLPNYDDLAAQFAALKGR